MTDKAAAPNPFGDTWFPSRFGAEDEIGTLNYLGPENVVRAAKLVDRGKVYSLAVPTGPDTPAYPPRSFQMHIVSPAQYGGTTWGVNQAGGIDEFMITWAGIGTHLDGLGHVAINNVFYNGTKADDVYQHTGVKKFGTDTLPPIVTRGVLLDIAALKGVDIMAPGEVITPEDIEAALKRQDLRLQRGDAVMLRTGWIKLLDSDPEKFMGSVPGIGKAAAHFFAEAETTLIGVDQYATEVMPAEDDNEFIPVHQINLTINGIYQLQNVILEELARDNVFEFLFVLGLPRFVGATQMTANPVAIR